MSGEHEHDNDSSVWERADAQLANGGQLDPRTFRELLAELRPGGPDNDDDDQADEAEKPAPKKAAGKASTK